MMVGWNTITSPWSSPRISIRSVSRLSSRLPAMAAGLYHASTAIGPSTARANLVHRRGRHRLEQLLIFIVVHGRRGITRKLVLTQTCEAWNGPRFFVELQHREHVKPLALVHIQTQDDERGTFTLDVRVGMGIRLDKHDIVTARRQNRLDQIEEFGCAVDDDHLLHRTLCTL